jgi:anti-sigma B factor antagonist
MDISITQYKRCDLVKVSGRIDSNTAPVLEETFNSIIDGGKSGIAFDMSEVEFISSRGIWVILETQKACRKNKGKLVLVSVSEDMLHSLDLAGVKHFVEIYDDVLTAVASF